MEIGIRQHAVLYALIVQSCFLNMEKTEAETLVKKITQTYGLRRGKRMRFLAVENKEETDMNAFLIHSEWKGKEGENRSKMIYEADRTVSEVTKCAWCDVWKKYGLMEYGPYYCRYIDQAICEGFNGDFDLKISSVLSQGGSCCRFEWSGCADEKTVSEGKATSNWILPFSFHCLELLECAKEVLRKHGREEILEEVKQKYVKIFPENEDLFH